MGGNQNGDVSRAEMVSGGYTLLWESGIRAGEDMKKAEQAYRKYITVVEFRRIAGYVCRADSVEYLEMYDKCFIGWLRKYKPPAGRKTRLRAWQLLMRSVKGAFALLLAKVTKHIPPQTSPAGSSLAGIWSTMSKHLCKTLYYNLYNIASGNFLLEREK